jgi:hypothetical protein
MKLSSDVIKIIWSLVGIGGLLYLFITGGTIGWKGWKYWGKTVALLAVVIAIYGLSTIDLRFAGGLTLLATLTVAGMALMSFRQTANLETRRAKEAVLKEITDWATEIQNAPWQVPLPPEATLAPVDPSKLYDANVLLKYGTVSTKNDYIRRISEKAFDGKLKESVEALINTLTIFVYLKYKSLGAINPVRGFGGTYQSLVLAFEEESKKEGKTTDQLVSEYGRRLPETVNRLLIKIAEIRVSLLDSRLGL